MRLALPPMIFDAAFGVDAPDDTAEIPDDEEAEAPEGEAGDEGNDDDPGDLDDE